MDHWNQKDWNFQEVLARRIEQRFQIEDKSSQLSIQETLLHWRWIISLHSSTLGETLTPDQEVLPHPCDLGSDTGSTIHLY